MTTARPKMNLPHPAVILDNCPQLLNVIEELEAGTYPQPDVAVWRDDLPEDLAERLARATGATDEQIAEALAAQPLYDCIECGKPVFEGQRVADYGGCKPHYECVPAASPAPEPEPEPEPEQEPAPGCKRLTIKHTHEDGTLIYGTEKGDGVYELIGPRTAARFRFFPSIRMIGIAQSRDHLAKRWQIDQAAKALREAGHVVTVEIDDTPRDVAQVKADRGERLDARHERLTAKAARSMAEAQQRHAAADAIGERFAGGQPILVGHHSERRARRDKERMQQNDRAAHAAYDKAERASQAAAVVGSADAYRERPAVIRRRIDRLEAELRQTDHYINGTRPANDWRGAYSYDREPATGAYLEQLTARKAFLEHQIAGDRAALAEHEANGYVLITRETVHKGDLVTWRAWPHDERATVTRVNPKTVTLDRTRWPGKLGYEQIRTVECPHEGTTTTVRAPKREEARAEPEPVKVERPAERPAPVEVGASSEFFPTPRGIAERMADQAGIRAGMTVLEPSAGLGAIASVAIERGAAVDCIELECRLAGRLKDIGARTVWAADFLDVPARPEYDAVLMNPPFKGQADIRHVTHALGFVKPGGLLVAVMSAGAEFRQDKTAEAFRELVDDRGGWLERLPEDAFEASGTSVRTIMAVIPAPVENKPAAPEPAPADEYAEAEAAGMLFA